MTHASTGLFLHACYFRPLHLQARRMLGASVSSQPSMRHCLARRHVLVCGLHHGRRNIESSSGNIHRSVDKFVSLALRQACVHRLPRCFLGWPELSAAGEENRRLCVAVRQCREKAEQKFSACGREEGQVRQSADFPRKGRLVSGTLLMIVFHRHATGTSLLIVCHRLVPVTLLRIGCQRHSSGTSLLIVYHLRVRGHFLSRV
mmetsp:Transcript_58204/g.85327  ORF Transcript_58204/g.85327 Transcript_58204/m.85327 type:complete len:203 (+) Transcript_58204:67-675(+)